MKNYLSERTHRTKMNDFYSSFLDLLTRVPKGSILGSLSFNIYICKLFFFIDEEDLTRYTGDTTRFSNGTNVFIENKMFLIGFRKTMSRQILTNRILGLQSKKKLL